MLLLLRTRRLGYDSWAVFLWVLLAFPVGAIGAALLAKTVMLLSGQSSQWGPLLEVNGLTVLGSTVACLAFSFVYVPIVFRQPPWRLLDAVAFTYPLSIAIGRIGCLLEGCCFGGPADHSPALLTVQLGDYSAQSAASAALHGLPASTALWNLPLLFILNALVCLVLTELVFRRRERWGLGDGTTVAIAISLESAGRFFIEPLRFEASLSSLPLNPWQFFDLILWCVVTAFVAHRLWARTRRQPVILSQ